MSKEVESQPSILDEFQKAMPDDGIVLANRFAVAYLGLSEDDEEEVV